MVNQGMRNILFRLCRVAVGAACALALSGAAVSAQEIETKAKHAILVDLSTNTVLFQKAGEEPTAPASMSKMMLLYMVFERLAAGTLHMEDTFNVSEKAWRMGGSKMFVRVATRVSLTDLLKGIIIQSGNDACIVVAEGLASSETEFARQMTQRGRELGLLHSTFVNSTGWPDEGQIMSVHDIALLATHLIRDFPQYYSLFSETTFTYNDIKQGNRNPLLYDYPGADGVKTGHTDEAGYGIAASAERNGRRVVLVVQGLATEKERATEVGRLMDWGFREFSNYTLFRAGDVAAEAPVWLGERASVPLVVGQDMTLTLGRNARKGMTVKAVYDGPLPASIRKGDHLGDLVVELPGQAMVRVPLLAGADIDQLGLFGRLGAALSYLVWGPAAAH